MSAYEPGTVAMSRYGRVFRTERGWYFDDGSGPTTEDDPPGGLRPLLVLDHDDREQATKLCEAIPWLGSASNLVDDVQAALRSMLTLPKPPEPTALFALVEDADGATWYRSAEQNSVWRKVYRSTGGRYVGCDSTPRSWSEIAPVRVLSEGYTGAEQ